MRNFFILALFKRQDSEGIEYTLYYICTNGTINVVII